MSDAISGGQISDRESMIAELKCVVQPFLRSAGFAGSFPHYRKISTDCIDLLTFQFDRRGGGFVIEIARCPTDGIVTALGLRVPPNKTKVWDIHPNFRKRIQQRPGGGTDAWFRFDAVSPARIAAEALSRLTLGDLWEDVRISDSKQIGRASCRERV